eukprot:9206957-Lingulodinium_polyedra.AAC.1
MDFEAPGDGVVWAGPISDLMDTLGAGLPSARADAPRSPRGAAGRAPVPRCMKVVKDGSDSSSDGATELCRKYSDVEEKFQ